MNELTLVYFKMRAFAEAPQMMMRYRTQPYRYQMAWDYFGRPWAEAKLETPFRQLPMLVTEDGVQIVQTGAIMRYLARRLSLVPSDPAEAARVDAVFETSQDLFLPLNPTVNFAVGEAFEVSREGILTALAPKLDDFERLLESHGASFFFGETPYYCDFGVFHQIDLAHFLDEALLSAHPKMTAFMAAMRDLSGVEDYLAERPALIGVGTEPRLVIRDTAVPTGIVAD